MVDEPEEAPTWRVRYGVGLVQDIPLLSDERREIIRRESEKEARAEEFAAEQRRTAALERRWDLERQGVVPHSHADVLARVSYGMDRVDKIEERREREAAEILGKPEPRLNRWEVEANVRRTRRSGKARRPAKLMPVNFKVRSRG